MDEAIGQRLHEMENHVWDVHRLLASIRLDLVGTGLLRPEDEKFMQDVTEAADRFYGDVKPPELRVVPGSVKRRTARRGKLRLVS